MNSPSKSPIPAQERRTSERFSPDPAPRCRLVPEGLAELPAVLLDLCSGGASLSVGPVLMAGQPLLLRLSRAGLPPLEIAGRVIYCEANDGVRVAILGCKFSDPLGEDEVKSLVGA